MRRAHLPPIAAGLAAFLVTLIVQLPARFVAALLPPTVTVGLLEGSPWSGRTDSVAVNGNHFGALRWRLLPLQLVRGRLAFDLELDRDDGQARAQVGVRLGNRVEARELVVNLPIAALPPRTRAERLGRADSGEPRRDRDSSGRHPADRGHD